MKSSILLTSLVLVFLGNAFSQTDAESQIKLLENEEITAILKHDYPTLEKIWAEDFMVNNPFNMVITGRSIVIDRMKEGIINYSGFEREIEKMMDLGNTVIVMGLETVYPKEGAPLAGQKVQRRYTNIWILEDEKWHIKARHANVICRGD
ncbi:nuclear transport factor 2 family protein [Cecembia lonarensis]|uniref:DUF4440 domain-containing protein n=1 Tax=Cecembia lonarensis (strain CCUG 58316 / KCTC 22772 / LW9) TaxID=1225176 RepID=K1LLI6_CECL9|nr:nuclear transport factor 2 family protein [Cecembia lonarensis]EKB51233.1 hypothetical protein B879_00027 [Cecembia lonarensis LW9]